MLSPVINILYTFYMLCAPVATVDVSMIE